jgi:uncharacterized membrane protein
VMVYMSGPGQPSTISEKLLKSITIIVGIVIIFCIALLLISFHFLVSPIEASSLLSLLLGSLILICGYYHLIYMLPKTMREMETRISMEALRASYWLVIFGLVIIVLCLLHLMGVLPPVEWCA